MIHGKKFVVGSSRAMASVSEWKLWYKVATSIKQSEMHKLANNYFPFS